MIAIVDYGMGNLRSAQKGFEKAGFEAVITSDAAEILDADGVVLPGVGAFKDCYDGLCDAGFADIIYEVAERGTPLLGICVGHQLLFDHSDEGKGSVGLGLLKGNVVRFPDAKTTGLKVPHMGWNRLKPKPGGAARRLVDLDDTHYVYFVHSYYAEAEDTSIVQATADYGVEFTAVVGKDNIFGVQFHPEKSQREGIAMLGRFGAIVSGATV